MARNAFQERKRQLVKDVGGKALWTVEKLMGRFSSVPDRNLLDARIFPWTQTLEANYEVIRDEMLAVSRDKERLPSFQDISQDQISITSDDRWKTYFLYGFGFKSEQNCARCPETTRLIEAVPGMKTAFFSILAPGKHIPAHRGPYKGVLRYHLGLVVPEPNDRCRIRVGDDVAHWEEGGSLLFDDTYEHEVWNDTDGERVVLFMDVVRPVRFPVNLLNEAIIKVVAHSSYIQDAKHNQETWERRFEAMKV